MVKGILKVRTVDMREITVNITTSDFASRKDFINHLLERNFFTIDSGSMAVAVNTSNIISLEFVE